MDIARIFNDKKFMWDGKSYPDEKSVLEIVQKYKNDGFETEIIKEQALFYIFSRKKISEVKVEEKPN
jgi:hypothetical protein